MGEMNHGDHGDHGEKTRENLKITASSLIYLCDLRDLRDLRDSSLCPNITCFDLDRKMPSPIANYILRWSQIEVPGMRDSRNYETLSTFLFVS